MEEQFTRRVTVLLTEEQFAEYSAIVTLNKKRWKNLSEFFRGAAHRQKLLLERGKI